MDGHMGSGAVLAVVITCIVLAMLTVVTHAMSLTVIRRRLNHRISGKIYVDHVFVEAVIISATVLSLSLVHLAEVCIWAGAYVLLDAIGDPRDAIYYSLSTYTTLGPDGVSIDRAFRAVAGFESLIGPMMVAWSTAFLVEFVVRMRGGGAAGAG